MDRLEKRLFIGGLTVLLAFIGSWLVLWKAHYHTAVREGAIAASDAACFLVLLWVLIAGVFALRRWRATSVKFRITLALNAAVVVLLLADFLRFR